MIVPQPIAITVTVPVIYCTAFVGGAVAIIVLEITLLRCARVNTIVAIIAIAAYCGIRKGLGCCPYVDMPKAISIKIKILVIQVTAFVYNSVAIIIPEITTLRSKGKYLGIGIITIANAEYIPWYWHGLVYKGAGAVAIAVIICIAVKSPAIPVKWAIAIIINMVANFLRARIDCRIIVIAIAGQGRIAGGNGIRKYDIGGSTIAIRVCIAEIRQALCIDV